MIVLYDVKAITPWSCSEYSTVVPPDGYEGDYLEFATLSEIFERIFLCILGKCPPAKYLMPYYLVADEGDGLADWCLNNVSDELSWTTGYGLYEAVTAVFTTAIENGNIRGVWHEDPPRYVEDGEATMEGDVP